MWHGYSDGFETFLDMPILDRLLHNLALNELIELGDATSPTDVRR